LKAFEAEVEKLWKLKSVGGENAQNTTDLSRIYLLNLFSQTEKKTIEIYN